MVEFALLLLPLLLLVFGAIEFGRVFHATHVITSAAREGARAAAVNENDNNIELKIEGAVSSLISNPANVIKKTSDTEYTANNPAANQVFFLIDRSGNTATIKVKGSVKIVVPLIGAILVNNAGNTRVVSSEAQMRIE